MSTYRTNDEDLQQREQELHEREMKLRLRELEAELEDQKKKVADIETEEKTVQNELDPEALAKQRKTRKLVFFGKLAALSVGVGLIVITLNVLLFPMIVVGALAAFFYGCYHLFIKESSKPKK